MKTKDIWDSMGQGRPSQEQVRRALIELSEEGSIVKDDSSKTHYFFKPEDSQQQHKNPNVGGDIEASQTVSPTISNGKEIIGDSLKATQIQVEKGEFISTESPTGQSEENVNPNLLEEVRDAFSANI